VEKTQSGHRRVLGNGTKREVAMRGASAGTNRAEKDDTATRTLESLGMRGTLVPLKSRRPICVYSGQRQHRLGGIKMLNG